MKKFLIILVLLILIIGGYFLWLKVISPKVKEKVIVTIDATKSGKDVSSVFQGTNAIIFNYDFQINQPLWDTKSTNSRNWEYYKKDIGFEKGLVRLWTYGQHHLPSELDIPLEYLAKNGGTAIVNIAGMPRNLSSRPKDTQDEYSIGWPRYSRYPPKDWDEWADYVYNAVYHWNVEKNYSVKYFEIWNEPDIFFWEGTQEELFKLYQVTADAAKKADPTAKVGGMAFAGWKNPFHKEQAGNPKDSLLYQFIQYVKDNNLPLDFISWHAYTPATDYAQEPVSTVKQWLSEAGYPKAETIIDEWGITGSSKPMEDRDTEYNSALIANRLIDFAQSGLNWQAYFSLSDLGPDNFGVFALSGVIKPSYNGLKMFSMMAENELESQSNEDNLKVLATKNEEKITLILTNYQPESDRSFAKLLKSKLRSAKINLRINGLDSKTYRYERYLVDATHANSFTIKDKISQKIKDAKKESLNSAKNYLLTQGISQSDIERLVELYQNNPEAIKEEFKTSPQEKQQIYLEALKIYQDTQYKTVEEINNWPEVKLAKAEERNIKVNGIYQETITLEPYATTLIILTEIK